MPENTTTACPVCGLDDQEAWSHDFGERTSVKCGRCGEFQFTGTASAMLESRELGPKFSAWLRQHAETGSKIPEIDSRALNQIESLLPSYRVPEKLVLLMRAIERRTDFPGKKVHIVTTLDHPLAWASSEDELQFLLGTLLERGLLRRFDGHEPTTASFSYDLAITAAGWEYIEEHQRAPSVGAQAFVAMSFSEDLSAAWMDGIKPGIVGAGYRPFRVDVEPHLDRIDAKIIAEIRKSRFLVADVTAQRPGVYYEAGFAQGIDIPVFWCVREDDLKNVHFDTRQYNHIVWSSPQDLEEKLRDFIEALVGHGPET